MRKHINQKIDLTVLEQMSLKFWDLSEMRGKIDLETDLSWDYTWAYDTTAVSEFILMKTSKIN